MLLQHKTVAQITEPFTPLRICSSRTGIIPLTQQAEAILCLLSRLRYAPVVYRSQGSIAATLLPAAHAAAAATAVLVLVVLAVLPTAFLLDVGDLDFRVGLAHDDGVALDPKPLDLDVRLSRTTRALATEGQRAKALRRDSSVTSPARLPTKRRRRGARG
ncbi:hypothetical protein HYQ46_007883 [Verticillium longisporum]|nr:hypothetical protein HYQ46_007883 [Verticillium longisporum]